jgi:hypothetical protein
MEQVFRHIEPTIINVRPGKNEKVQEDIVSNLSNDHGFVNLDVKDLQNAEMERNTIIG